MEENKSLEFIVAISDCVKAMGGAVLHISGLSGQVYLSDDAFNAFFPEYRVGSRWADENGNMLESRYANYAGVEFFCIPVIGKAADYE